MITNEPLAGSVDRLLHLITTTTLAAALAACVKSPAPTLEPVGNTDWPVWGADAAGTRYSGLHQIDRTNVQRLEIAWIFHTGEAEDHGFAQRRSHTFQATPLVANGLLYLSAAHHGRVYALDPATGTEIGRFDAKLGSTPSQHDHPFASRGVTLWNDPEDPDAPCARRVLFGTRDGRLIALDAMSGRRCHTFGHNGEIDLTADVGANARGHYDITSPPVVFGALVISGSRVADLQGEPAQRGIVRAFDARSGALVWTWDPIPRSAQDPAWPTWKSGSAMLTGAGNAWAPLSVDRGRDLVFVPTSAPGSSLYGGYRPGRNDYTSSLVALRASTGEVVWHQQLVHHDVWDYDVASQPTLIEVIRDGEQIPLVVQPTKMGMLFVFHRETGEPWFPIEERPVPQNGVPGEELSPTQPFPDLPPPLVSHAAFDARDAWGLTFWDRGKCREKMSRLRSEGIYTPPSLQGTLFTPGYAGGMNWGGGSFDARSATFFINVMEVPSFVRLIPNEQVDDLVAGGDIDPAAVIPQPGIPYSLMTDYVLSPLGVPCTPPPWGKLAAVDMVSGRIRWSRPLGTIEDLTPVLVPNLELGVPNIGGSIVTGSGLVFIGAAADDYLRAFDNDNGEELWKGRLPAGGQATPMTYAVDGRQYMVIAAGGHAYFGTHTGDALLAFALPRE